MLCDECGYNLKTSLKCPNCGHDNTTTDYKPVDMNLLYDPMDELVEEVILDIEKRAEHQRDFH